MGQMSHTAGFASTFTYDYKVSMTEKPLKVLCVDDNIAVAGMLSLTIENEAGLECVGILHRADGLLTAIAERKPDIVLLDLSMPGRPPLEVLAEAAAAYPDTRVIVCSAFEDRETINRAVEAGAWGYVAKDANSHEVIAAIRRVAEGQFVLPAS